jgi:prepilin-type N-terminal cleavage/methylation domain-containing protein
MTSRRGFTLVEVLMSSILASLIVAATGGLMVFASKRAQHAYSENAVVTQVMQLSNELQSTISQSVGCTTQTNSFGTALKCTMPATGVDTDQDGKLDTWSASGVSSAGTEKYKTGIRVWYYWANGTADYTSTSTATKPQFFKAYRNDDASPTSADIDTRFSRLYATTGTRWNLVDTLSFSVSPTTGLINYTITASKLISQERGAGGVSSEDERDFRLSRSVMCQEWRK